MKVSAHSLQIAFNRVIDDDKGLTRFINLYHDRIYLDEVYLNDDFMRLYQTDQKLFDDTAKSLFDIMKAHPDWVEIPYFIKTPFQEQINLSAMTLRAWVRNHSTQIKFKDTD